MKRDRVEPGRGGKTTWARGVLWHYKKEGFFRHLYARTRARGECGLIWSEIRPTIAFRLPQHPTPKKERSFARCQQGKDRGMDHNKRMAILQNTTPKKRGKIRARAAEMLFSESEVL